MANFDYAHFRSQRELQNGVLMWQIFSPILILFGTVGNILSIKVLSKRRFNKWASSLYLIGLAVADLSILYIGLLRQWVKYLVDIDVRNESVVMCKVHWWLMYSNADISVWILISITVERLISSLFPYKSKMFCTKERAKFVLAGIFVFALLINSHLLYGFGKLEMSVGNATITVPCAPVTENYGKFFGTVWTWIDLCKYSLIPFAILSSGNVCIIYKVISSQRKARRRVGPVTNTDMATATASSSIPIPNAATSTINKNDKTSSMSLLLVVLNIMFIICTAPVCIYFIGEPYWIPKDVPRHIQLQDPWWALVNMMMYFNNTANFILYCVSGSRFREELKLLFVWRNSRVHSTSINIGTINANLSAARTHTRESMVI